MLLNFTINFRGLFSQKHLLFFYLLVDLFWGTRATLNDCHSLQPTDKVRLQAALVWYNCEYPTDTKMFLVSLTCSKKS